MSPHLLLRAAACLCLSAAPALAVATPRFEISFTRAAHAGPITGRLVLILSKTNQNEPRLLISPRGPAIFGVDLDQLAPDKSITLSNDAVGFPASLAEIPPGDYFAQAVINVYEQVRRSDGKTIWAHMNDGSVEFFSIAPGNVYSDVVPVHVGADGTIKIVINRVVPPAEPLKDTEWVKHVKIQSALLTKFWGRPVFVQAHVLLPKGYNENPSALYPSVYTLGHGQT